MMLEQQVVLMCYASYSLKDWAMHKVVGIAAKAVDYIMVIPHVQLSNLSICTGEWLRRIPSVALASP